MAGVAAAAPSTARPRSGKGSYPPIRSSKARQNNWDIIAAHLAQVLGDEVTASFEEIDGWAGGGLPDSARRHQAWWSGDRAAGTLAGALLRTSPGVTYDFAAPNSAFQAAQTNKTYSDSILRIHSVSKETHLVAFWIRKDGLECERCTRGKKLASHSACERRCSVSVQAKRERQHVGVDKSHARLCQVSGVEGRLTGAVGPGDNQKLCQASARRRSFAPGSGPSLGNRQPLSARKLRLF